MMHLLEDTIADLLTLKEEVNLLIAQARTLVDKTQGDGQWHDNALAIEITATELRRILERTREKFADRRGKLDDYLVVKPGHVVQDQVVVIWPPPSHREPEQSVLDGRKLASSRALDERD